MATKSKSTRKDVSFDEYKSIKDEIIEISEQRFENILTKRLHSFKREFKSELMAELIPRFDAIDTRFNAIDTKFSAIDSKFNAIDSKFGAIDSRFNAMDTKFDAIDSRFDSLEKRLSFITWFLPFMLAAIMALFKYIG